MSTPFDRIPKPLKGMNWEPSPSNYKTKDDAKLFGDTDFANDAFAALWGADAGIGRHDLDTIRKLGCNTIKMYNWSPPANQFRRDHKRFLAATKAAGLSAIVPISAYFTTRARINRESKSAADAANLKTAIQNIVAEVHAPECAGAAVLWSIGNEFDNAAKLTDGYCEAQDIATIAAYIVAAEENLGIPKSEVLAFTSAVTTAKERCINDSIVPSAPHNTLMGGCAVRELKSAFNARLGADVTGKRFIAAINAYVDGDTLKQHIAAFRSIFGALPFFYGELGCTAHIGEDAQATKIYDQFRKTIPLAKPKGQFYGACCFEFSDESWKGVDKIEQAMFGIRTFDTAKPAQGWLPSPHVADPDAKYPVDVLRARPAAAALQAALAGLPMPTAWA